MTTDRMTADRVQGSRMVPGKPLEQVPSLADQASQSAEQAVKSVQRLASDTLDGVANSAQEIRQEVAPLLQRASGQASAFAQRGLQGIRESSRQLQDSAQRATDSTRTYVKEEPVKAMLIAAATGAALMALARLLNRSRVRD